MFTFFFFKNHEEEKIALKRLSIVVFVSFHKYPNIFRKYKLFFL